VIIAWHPGAVRGLSALVRSEPLASWKQWLTFHAIDRNAAVLPKAFVGERFAFHGKVLNGTPQLAERWKRGVAATNAAIPEAVGQIYVARYFPPETKAQIQAMVKNLVTAFGLASIGSSGCHPTRSARPVRSCRHCAWASAIPIRGWTIAACRS
jgi:predicted metalloendopeptidase